MGDTTFHHGHMDVREQRSTYDFFMGLTKWGSLAVAVLLLFLVLAFCTPTGVGGAIVTSIIALALGAGALRKRQKGESGAP
jgi:hypothetical protein